MDIVFTCSLVLIAIIAVILLTSWLKVNAFIALFTVSLLLALATISPDKVITILKEGYGTTMASIGFLIVFGAMIGVILDRTGATVTVSEYILSKTGEKRGAHALGLTGFLTGLPIFCDSGFIVLSGLAKSLSMRTGIVMPFMSAVLATSLYSVHCLIPPHPGATAAAGIVGVDIGQLVILGILFAFPGAVSAFIWSRWITGNRKFVFSADSGEIKKEIPEKSRPPVVLSLLPVVMPLLLITFKTVLSMFGSFSGTLAYKVFMILGDPVIALFTGVIAALFLIREKNIESFNRLFGEAIMKAGPILIITAAGGTFGMVIKTTGTGEALGEVLAGTGLGLLVPFVIAVILKTAQGSSTVAIISAASFTAPMLSALGLESQSGHLFALLSMGAGSMIISHANDSYFWVVSNFSGIDTATNLKVYSSSTAIMGITVFILVWITSIFFL